MLTLTSFFEEPTPRTLRGGRLLSTAEAERLTRGCPRLRRVLGAPVPESQLGRGVVVQGGQGSGKSLTILRDFIAVQVARMARPGSRDKLILVDVKGDLTAATLGMLKSLPARPPVYLLNPFDRFSHALDPHEIADEPTRITRLVSALTHRKRDARTDDFFDTSARGHLVDLVKVLTTRVPGRWTWRDLYHIATDPRLLRRVLGRSRLGRRRTRDLVKKTFVGVVNTIQSWLDGYVAAFAGMAHSPLLGIESFLRGSGVVILTVPEDQLESLNPLARLLVRHVKDRLLADNGRDPASHTLLVLDEFAYLDAGVLEAAEPLFGRARSANATVVAAWQSWPAVCAAHGEKRMQGVVDNAAVRVWLGGGHLSAELAEKDCMRPEVLRTERSATSSPQSTSHSRTERVELRSNVLAAEVQSLLPPITDLIVRGYVSATHLGGPLYRESNMSEFVAYLNRLPVVPAVRPRPTPELWLDPWDDVADGNRLGPLFVPER